MTAAAASAGWDEAFDALPLGPREPCSYFPDRQQQLQYFRAAADVPPALLAAAFAHGFRRCGVIYYRTRCPTCNLCLGYRLRPDCFRPSRNLRRVASRNRDVVSRVVTPRCTRIKEGIYLRYQRSRHYLHPGPRPPAPFSRAAVLAGMQEQMYHNPVITRELELRLAGRLVGFGIMDVAADVVSLVYFAFDPVFSRRSPGTVNILRAIAWAAAAGCAHVYLGYYLPPHPKMAYKRRFGPAEIRHPDTGGWQTELPPLKGLP